jgi:hypothetical protein
MWHRVLWFKNKISWNWLCFCHEVKLWNGTLLVPLVWWVITREFIKYPIFILSLIKDFQNRHLHSSTKCVFLFYVSLNLLMLSGCGLALENRKSQLLNPRRTLSARIYQSIWQVASVMKLFTTQKCYKIRNQNLTVIHKFNKDGIKMQGRQYTYRRNIEARSRNHCCRGKTRSVTYSECVSVALAL